jgi:hypothetical protein
MEKICFKCGKVKPLSEYYVHNKMSDGHLNKCIECAKIDVKKYRVNNIEKIKEKDRNRKNKKERLEKNKKRMQYIKKTDPEKYKKQKLYSNYKYNNANKEKASARRKVQYHITKGYLTRPNKCERCNKEIYTQAHHEDYNKPLVIAWLCDACHKERHKEIREEKRNASL